MQHHKGSILILSITSDIATEFALRKTHEGYRIYGTYRQISDDKRVVFSENDINIIQMDVTEEESLCCALKYLNKIDLKWDCLMIATGNVAPVGPFELNSIQEWQDSFQTNFLGPMHFIHDMLRLRNKDLVKQPAVILFSGSGTNDSPQHYSAYTISKVALIKACEILDGEISDVKFSIIGPGIVDTKIHEPTISSKEEYPNSWKKLKQARESQTCTPMNDILDCCDWIIEQPKEVVGGRNFSVGHDNWRNGASFEEFLKENSNFLKIRRHGNNHEKISIRSE